VSYTPGPWQAELANKGQSPHIAPEFWMVVEDKQPPYRDAVVNIFWHDGIHTNDEANARLIASAPEMLELLKECVDGLNCQPGYVRSQTIMRMQVVIAKVQP